VDRENTALMATLKMLNDSLSSLHDKFDRMIGVQSEHSVKLNHIDQRVTVLEQSMIQKFGAFLSFFVGHPIMAVFAAILFGYFVTVAGSYTVSKAENKADTVAVKDAGQ